MSTGNLLHLIAREFGLAFQPLKDAISSPDAFKGFMLEMGWTVADIPQPILDLANALDRLEAALEPITTEDGSPEQYMEVIQSIRQLIDEIDDLSGATFDVRLAAVGFAATFPKQLVEYLIVDYLVRAHPKAAFLLTTLGIIRLTYVEAPSGDHHDHVRRNLAWVDFSRLMQDPVQLLENAFGWRTDHLAHEVLLRAATNLAFSAGLQASFDEMEPTIARRLENGVIIPGEPARYAVNVSLFHRVEEAGELALGLKLMGLPRDGTQLPGFALLPYALGNLGEAYEINSRWKLSLASTLDLTGGVGIVLRPHTGFEIIRGLNNPATSSTGEGSLHFKLVNQDPEREPILLIGSEDGSRFDYKSLSVTMGALLKAGADPDLFAELKLEATRLIIKAGESDGFLNRILPAEGIKAEFDLAPGISRQRGFYFSGSGSLDVEIPAHYSLGPIDLHGVTLAVRPTAEDGTIPVTLGATLVTKLGPLTGVVDNIGLKATFSFPDDMSGALGPLDIDIGFKPPDGIGIVVDAGRITGGGFLHYDDSNGRYVGALELEVYDYAVKAFGILDTRLPGGDPPYSFLIMISVEFMPIPIGFGFMLAGVGGLAGIHRRLATDAFRERLKQGAIEHILFPANPIEDAPAIASDLSAVMPPAADRYVFGPMAKFTWGPLTLVEGKLGILLELPEPVRLVLLGQFSVALPRRDVPLVLLNFDLLGEIDFARLSIALDGTLFDSNIVGLPIEGDFAARVKVGSDPILALSAGGFHPSYAPPAGFPALRRITIPAGFKDNPRITLEGYIALTSNTLQVGALASLYASAGGFTITGHIGFDALFTLKPFAFVTDFSGKVALNRGMSQIAAIQLSASLSGPSPWHVVGEACLEIRCLPDICVGFDKTFGNPVELLLPILDPFLALRDAMQNPESWSGARPDALYRAATMSPVGSGARALIDPGEGVTMRQTVVPLARRITRFGAGQPAGGAARFDIGTLTIGGAESSWTQVDDLFAPAQFEDLSDDQKLTRPDFERMDAGLTVARDAVALGQAVGAAIEYETRIIDSAVATRPGEPYQPELELQLAAAALSSAAMSPWRASGATKFAPPPGKAPLVALDDDRFVVVSITDLAERRDIVLPAKKGAAFQALDEHLASHPEDRGRLDVVSLDELAEAEV